MHRTGGAQARVDGVGVACERLVERAREGREGAWEWSLRSGSCREGFLVWCRCPVAASCDGVLWRCPVTVSAGGHSAVMRAPSHTIAGGISRFHVLKLCPPWSRVIDETRAGAFTFSMNFCVGL